MKTNINLNKRSVELPDQLDDAEILRCPLCGEEVFEEGTLCSACSAQS